MNSEGLSCGFHVVQGLLRQIEKAFAKAQRCETARHLQERAGCSMWVYEYVEGERHQKRGLQTSLNAILHNLDFILKTV